MQPTRVDPARVPDLPVAIGAEKFILGSCLCHGRFPEAAEVLQAEQFAEERHRVLFGFMQAIHEAGDDVNFSTVAVSLEGRIGDIERIGGLSYVIDLENGLPNLPEISPYVRAIREAAAKRRMMLKLNEAMLRLGEPGADTLLVAAEIEEEIRNYSASVSDKSGFSTPREIILEAGGLDGYLGSRIEEAIGYPWQRLNHLTGGGMRRGQLIVVAGPPGRGKTALALNIACGVAARNMGVVLFSLEMDPIENNDRLISIVGGFDSRLLRRTTSNAENREKVRNAVGRLTEMPIYIRNETSPSIAAIRSQAKKLNARHPVGLIVVDYLQLASSGAKGKPQTRAEEVGAVSRGLKRLAMEMQVPVLALSQINRDSARDNRAPELHDLRESGSIEADANAVFMLHMVKPFDIAAGIEVGEINLLIRKQRSGPTGSLPLRFFAPSGVFREPDDERWEAA